MYPSICQRWVVKNTTYWSALTKLRYYHYAHQRHCKIMKFNSKSKWNKKRSAPRKKGFICKLRIIKIILITAWWIAKCRKVCSDKTSRSWKQETGHVLFISLNLQLSVKDLKWTLIDDSRPNVKYHIKIASN